MMQQNWLTHKPPKETYQLDVMKEGQLLESIHLTSNLYQLGREPPHTNEAESL